MNKLTLLVASLALAVVGNSATASPMIRLSDGTAVVDVADNSAQDVDGEVGRITFVGAVGANWLANTTTGASGAPTEATLRLTGLHATNIGDNNEGVSLDVWLTDTSFSLGSVPSLLNVLGHIEGSTQGMVTWDLFIDSGNVAFGTEHLIGGDTNDASDFTSALAGSALVDGTFSMTLHVRINHGNFERTTSFDFEGLAQLVPEPGTLALFGIGLAALGLRRRR